MSILSRVPEFVTCLLHLKAYECHIDRQGPFQPRPQGFSLKKFKGKALGTRLGPFMASLR